MKLILDMGSGNTCRNDMQTVRDMIDAIASVDTGRHEIILKWQLFKSAPPNIPLDPEIFNYAYLYALGRYQTTASAFDVPSLTILKWYDVPFIKIACRPDLYPLIDDTSKYYVSVDHWAGAKLKNINIMACVPKYPATIKEYETAFLPHLLRSAISDHTVGWELYNKYHPAVMEKHFVHKRDKSNPDAGAFAVTAKELKEIM